ncbi:piggyBac transposable element-derived protein 4-like [Ixodes scapularis]|uniref:piggyBac transposable element-derived protein 4-like n=1 Tax=Ixodes scapularis TaxID=6945 RepID=UPI001A9DF533|nr:piggyBac transposable element-derived protein 4-like [Ixodes scapularis]
MSRNRWEKIKANLHFKNNDSMPCPNDPHRDRLFDVRPLIDLLLPQFGSFPQDQALCVDDQMVSFKGHSSLKQYIPSKPHKWGHKMYVLCDSRDIVHLFDIYTGTIDPVPGEPGIGASGNIVLKLAQVIQPGLNHLLFCDNWVTSLKLLTTLTKTESPLSRDSSIKPPSRLPAAK